MLVMAQGNGEVAVRDPESLVKEIERTRESLARTIDALTDRVSPGNVARRTLARLRDQAMRPQVQLAGAIAVAALAGAAYLRWRHRR
jgi:Protein of unknown function (DUF3618)